MPTYVLTQHYTQKGVVIAQGSILSTDAPPGSIFHLDPQDAERLVDEGVLQEHSPEVLTGARSTEPGWTSIERRDRDDEAGGDFRAPWG